MKTHWLHGEVTLTVEVETETNCRVCLHRVVCERVEDLRCSNHQLGDSRGHRGCQQCTHKFTRWDQQQPIPCFHCKDFLVDETVDILA